MYDYRACANGRAGTTRVNSTVSVCAYTEMVLTFPEIARIVTFDWLA
jgi:hypothetical protein